MAAAPEIEVIAVESVTLTEQGTVVAIKLETAAGFQTIRLPFQVAIGLMGALDAALLPNEAVPIASVTTH